MHGTSIVEQTDESRQQDELRERLREMWAAVAPGWGEHADYVDERSAQLTERMLERVAIAPGERVLELACGAGGAGLAAAPLVGRTGEVVLSDVAAEMTAIAAARARALGLHNVATSVLDLQEIDEPDGSYDVVIRREGLMLAPDPAPGLMFDAISAQLGCPVPPTGIPGPFSLEDADRLAGLLTAADLSDVSVLDVDFPLHERSFEQWWTTRCDLAGPLTKILASVPDEVRAAIRARARDATQPYTTPVGLEFPGVALLASARRG